jgi:hypothetical protein
MTRTPGGNFSLERNPWRIVGESVALADTSAVTGAQGSTARYELLGVEDMYVVAPNDNYWESPGTAIGERRIPSRTPKSG